MQKLTGGKGIRTMNDTREETVSIQQRGLWWVRRMHRGAGSSAGLGLGVGPGKAFMEGVTQICELKVKGRGIATVSQPCLNSAMSPACL